MVHFDFERNNFSSLCIPSLVNILLALFIFIPEEVTPEKHFVSYSVTCAARSEDKAVEDN